MRSQMSYLVSLYFINAGRFYNVLTGFIKKTSAAGSLVNTDSYVHKLRIILISLLPKNNKKKLANDTKQTRLGCRSAAVCHQLLSSDYLHHSQAPSESEKLIGCQQLSAFLSLSSIHTVLMQS